MGFYVQFFPDQQDKEDILQRAANPKYVNYLCGACGNSTTGRMVARVQRPDGLLICCCVCSCPQTEPTVLTMRTDSDVVAQMPALQEFQPGKNWPPDLAQLFQEAAKAYAAGAYTAAAMVARKVLMACACHEGDAEDRKFVQYVDYLTNEVLTFPRAKDAITRIKDIGNDANHVLSFVTREDAHRALSIVTYLLNTVYSLPLA